MISYRKHILYIIKIEQETLLQTKINNNVLTLKPSDAPRDRASGKVRVNGI